MAHMSQQVGRPGYESEDGSIDTLNSAGSPQH